MRSLILFYCVVLFIQIDVYGQSGVQKKTREGLFLKRGLGISGELELGKPVTLSDEKLNLYKKRFGLGYKVSKDTFAIVRSITCNKPGCITIKNVGIGVPGGVVVRRFGPPLQERKLKDGSLFMAYDGVAFRVEKERISVIYIIPFRKKK